MRFLGCAAVLALASWNMEAKAAPPAAATVGVSAVGEAQWVKHLIIPGERVSEIANRYGVSTSDLLRWNKLDAKRPLLRVGRELRILTRQSAPLRKRISYAVRAGDSWSKIARRFDVSQQRLRGDWNPKARALVAGQRVTVWIDETPVARDDGAPSELTEDAQTASLPLVGTPDGGVSVGSAAHGRLVNGVPLPINDALYTIRNPQHSWGNSLCIDQLQRGIALFRQRTGFDREIVIMDISRKRGGRFRPHHSHTSGRDVDIRLLLPEGGARGTIPLRNSQVDWDATWSLIEALRAGGQLKYVFLSRIRQQALYEAARRAGRTPAELSDLIQFPKRSRSALVRHSKGHTKHFHVRFKCSAHETQCIDL